MVDFRKLKDYEIDEAEIDKAIHILSVYDPENATPEKAIDFLVWLRTEVHSIAHNSAPGELEELYKKYTEQSEKN
jgi:hypothetical protein